jgi:hypothetical protein
VLIPIRPVDSPQIVSGWGDRDHCPSRDHKFVIHLPRDTNDRSRKWHDVIIRGNADDLDNDWMDPECLLHVSKSELPFSDEEDMLNLRNGDQIGHVVEIVGSKFYITSRLDFLPSPVHFSSQSLLDITILG